MATYNLINSVKGGCGKTTFSIWLAHYLDNSLLIDMDLLGTSMQVIFNGNMEGCKTAFTNDIFQGKYHKEKEFVEKIELKTKKSIHAIFSSMDSREKRKFKSGKYSGYSPVVKHSMVRLGLKELLGANSRLGENEVEHFIFDMPPSSDGFADAAEECIFNSNYSDLKKKDRRNLFMLIGTDWGQTIATIQELEDLLLRRGDQAPDRIFLVLNNNNIGSAFGDDHYKTRKDKIQDALKNWKIEEEIRKKIFFLKMAHNKHYAALGIGAEKGGKGLKSASVEEINNAFRGGIVASAKCGEEFEDIIIEGEQDKLRNLILGDEAKGSARDGKK